MGKKEIPKKGGKEAAKQATQKPVESTRSTRGASRTPLQEKVAPKRKASPSPAPKKATPAKKTRSASPSPAPAVRLVYFVCKNLSPFKSLNYFQHIGK